MKLNIKKSKTIKGFLTIAIGTCLTFVAITTSGAVFLTGKALIERMTKEEVLLISDSLTSNIRGYLDKMETAITIVGTDPKIQDAVEALNKEKGKVLGDATHIDNESVKDLQKKLDTVKQTEPAVLHAYIGTNKDKYQKTPVETYANDYKASQRGWYKGAVEKGELYWTEPYMDFAVNKTCITAAYPIKSNDEVIAVLGFDLDLEYIANQFTEFKVGEKGFYSLIAPTGAPGEFKTVYNSNSELATSTVDKIITDDKSSETEAAIDGLSTLLTNASNELDRVGRKLDSITVNGEKYQVAVQNDEAIGLQKVIAVNDKEAKIKSNQLLTASVGMALLTGLAGLAVLQKVLSKLGAQLNLINNTVSKLQEGDLTIEVEGDILNETHEAGQLAKNLNNTSKSLRGLIGKIDIANNELNGAAKDVSVSASETNARIEEIATTMNDIVSGISEQASHAEDSNSAVTKLANRLDELKETSSSISTLTLSVKKENEVGLISVDELKLYTEENNSSSKEVYENIQELSKKTESIETIVETMSGIAEQTNLLALNAAIEAARAGEMGAGFSVVAGEVKKLAEESSKHAETIRTIVSAIQKDVNSTVSVMNKSLEISEKQTNAVSSVVSTFETISDSTENMNEKIMEIDEFVNIINTDKEIIVESVEMIARVSQRSAAASEEISASIQEQTALSQTLADTASKLDALSSELNEEIKNFEI